MSSCEINRIFLGCGAVLVVLIPASRWQQRALRKSLEPGSFCQVVRTQPDLRAAEHQGGGPAGVVPPAGPCV